MGSPRRAWLWLNLIVGVVLMVVITAASVYLLSIGRQRPGVVGLVVVGGAAVIFVVFDYLHARKGNL